MILTHASSVVNLHSINSVLFEFDCILLLLQSIAEYRNTRQLPTNENINIGNRHRFETKSNRNCTRFQRKINYYAVYAPMIAIETY